MISVRPERISILPAANDNRGRATGRIESVTFLGLDTLYEVSLAGNVLLRSRRRDAHPALTTGETVVVDWPDDVERQLAK
jgi:spermidine/putrescine transport system ATP-binding protein